jgi:hypothetical protein
VIQSVAWLVLTLAGTAGAQPRPVVEVGGATADRLFVAVDADDDDEDGRPDAAQDESIPAEDVLRVRVRGTGPAVVRVEGALRLVSDGRAARELRVRLDAEGEWIGVQGVSASTGTGEHRLTITPARGTPVSLPVVVVGIALLDAHNRALDAATDSVRPSHRITNDASLPRGVRWGQTSPDPRNIRLEVWDPSASGDEVRAVVESFDAGSRRVRTRRELVLTRDRPGRPFRSPFVRLVGDQMDQEAPGVGDRVLRVALRDVVQLRYLSPTGPVTQSLRVGRPGDEDGSDAARRGRLRIRILRTGGVPAVGTDARGALAIGRRQVAIANEIWLQCLFDFGSPEDADVAVVDPPVPSLVAISDGDGLPAVGGGEIRLVANGRTIGPVPTRPNAPAVHTALDLAAALRAAGLVPRVTVNAATELGAGQSADVLVRDADGELVRLEAPPGRALGTDPRQSVQIGVVDLSDGIQEFDNMTAAAGTLEERALVKALGDDDPTTLDIFVVNRFTAGTRQGEAFIESDGGAVINTLILDRNGMRQEREAWTQSHELGHILLDHPLHPDHVGPDRPWLLMDADSSLGLVTGPKRLTPSECRRARVRSGPPTVPALLERLDARPRTPDRALPHDRGYPRS